MVPFVLGFPILSNAQLFVNGNATGTDLTNLLVGQGVTGTANFLTGGSAPVDLTTYTPLAGSAVVDAGQAAPTAAASFTVGHQLNLSTFSAVTRPVNGVIDLGALER